MNYSEEFIENDKGRTIFEIRLDSPKGRRVYTGTDLSEIIGWMNRQREEGKYCKHDFVVMETKTKSIYTNIVKRQTKCY